MSAGGPTGRPGPAGSVLVIEDDADIRTLLSSRLERLGYHVRAVETGEAGVAAAIAEPPGLVVLDILLPGIDGWEVARRLRAHPRTATVPLVIASIVEPEAEDHVVQASGYLVKPFNARQVESVVTRVVGAHRPATANPNPTRTHTEEAR